LELDWEYELSRWLGPIGSTLLAGHLRSRVNWAGDSLDSLRQTLADYLAEESRSLVGEREAQARFTELDDLKLALDRLDARLERLARRMKPDA
jgi:ubiquinone biosynthesis protein UbiJ